jgi:transcription elongation factor GreA
MLSKIFEKIETDTPISNKPAQRVSVNTSVTLMDLQEKQKVRLKIVSPALSNPEAGFVSFLSPLGAELIDKKNGDMIKVEFLGSQMKFQLIEIH